MIVPMQKITLIIPEADRFSAVEELRELGVLHIERVDLSENENRFNMEERVANINKVIGFLENMPERAEGKCSVTGAATDETGKAVFRRVREIVAARERLLLRMDNIRQETLLLRAWGDFDWSLLKGFRKRGLYLYLCESISAELRKLKEAGYVCVEISKESRTNRYVVVSDKPIAREELPLAKIPTDTSLSKLIKDGRAVQEEIAVMDAELQELRGCMSSIYRYREEMVEALEFLTVRDSLGDHGRLLTIGGFVPNPLTDRLRNAVRENGWGLTIRDADSQKEAVPTLIKRPKWANIVAPLFDFLEITPEYDEVDASIPVLFFFTIFFGILVGDAGYGLIYMLICLTGIVLKWKEPKIRQIFSFIFLLGSSATAWGILTGNFFGTPVGGIEWLTTNPNSQGNTQLVCFSLALLHLGLGRMMLVKKNWRDWRNVLTNLGGTIVLVGNYVLVYRMIVNPGPFPVAFLSTCYVVGVLIMAIGTIDFKDPGTIMGFPFDIVNTFVDLLSYIRLYAVGLAGYYMAGCFNDIAAPMFSSFGLSLVGYLILLIGHTMNILLGVLSVLVHGVRLNTLEFSGNAGITWGGHKFDPFRKKVKEVQ